MDGERLPVIGREVWPWAVPLVALLMLALVLTPAEVWHHPTNDAVYSGFDPNLIYVDEKGYAPAQGTVQVSPQSLKLTALANSQPTVHLLTTPLSTFKAALDLRILENGGTSTPLRIGLWSARAGSGYFLNFGPPPANLITAQTIVKGTTAQTLIGGDLVKRESLGRYSPGQLYHLEVILDKNSGIIRSRLSGQEAPPGEGAMLRLVGGPNDPLYGDVSSELVPATAGKLYSFGGSVKSVSGSDGYKITLLWLDQNQRLVGLASDWRNVQELSGWTEKELRATAPPKTAFARLNLGSGNGTQLLFANLFLKEAGSTANLLPNGDFQKGASGWTIAGQPSSTPQIIYNNPVSMESSVTASEAPELFNSLRLSLTASASCQSGIASTVLEDYRLTLPNQRGQVLKIDDSLATGLIIGLTALGGLLALIRAVTLVRGKGRQEEGLATRRRFLEALNSPLTLPKGALLVGAGVAIAAYFILSSLLFNLGSHPFDMTSQKAWAYICATSGPFQLYHLPDLVPLAKVWAGGPYHEAIFPYHPIMAYIFAGIGGLYRLCLSGPGGVATDGFQLELLIKAVNILFGLADALLIYLILRQWKVSQRWSLLGGGLFLLNPAVWFSMSIWGQNHVASLFFLLLSLWLAEKRHPQWAWLALAAACLTRPQVLVPAFLLGMVFLRKFSLRENFYAICWSVIVVFLVLSPFALSISPSLPVDLLAHQLFVQEGGGNETALTTVSLDAYSAWPLVTYFTEGARGLARFLHPSASPLIGDFSYQRVSLLLTAGLVLFVGGLLLFRRRSAAGPDDCLPLLASGVTGFLMLKTGLASTHFVLGLPLLILCRRSLGTAVYLSLIGIWTVTTLVPMYGIFAFAISQTGYLAPALHHSNNIVTLFFMELYSADWFITLGTLANMMVLVWMAWEALPPLFAWWRQPKARASLASPQSAEPVPGHGD